MLYFCVIWNCCVIQCIQRPPPPKSYLSEPGTTGPGTCRLLLKNSQPLTLMANSSMASPEVMKNLDFFAPLGDSPSLHEIITRLRIGQPHFFRSIKKEIKRKSNYKEDEVLFCQDLTCCEDHKSQKITTEAALELLSTPSALRPPCQDAFAKDTRRAVTRLVKEVLYAEKELRNGSEISSAFFMKPVAQATALWLARPRETPDDLLLSAEQFIRSIGAVPYNEEPPYRNEYLDEEDDAVSRIIPRCMKVEEMLRRLLVTCEKVVRRMKGEDRARSNEILQDAMVKSRTERLFSRFAAALFTEHESDGWSLFFHEATQDTFRQAMLDFIQDAYGDSMGPAVVELIRRHCGGDRKPPAAPDIPPEHLMLARRLARKVERTTASLDPRMYKLLYRYSCCGLHQNIGGHPWAYSLCRIKGSMAPNLLIDEVLLQAPGLSKRAIADGAHGPEALKRMADFFEVKLQFIDALGTPAIPGDSTVPQPSLDFNLNPKPCELQLRETIAGILAAIRGLSAA